VDEIRGDMNMSFLVRKLALWVGIGCTLVGLVSMLIPDAGGSLFYLVGFPLLCLVLFF
jgi:hypothetical protein